MVASLIDRHAGEWMRRPFITGEDDCAFAVRAILAEAGATQIYENRVGEFRTDDEIDAFIADETGGKGLVALICQIARRHGWRRVRPIEALDGDLVLIRGSDGLPVVGIVRGPMALTRARPGMAAIPKHAASVAFRVIYGS
jgi:hypothetical protein